MTDLIRSLVTRELGSQKSIKIFKDQEERVERLNKEFNLSITLTSIMRQGVDNVLDSLEEQLKAEVN